VKEKGLEEETEEKTKKEVKKEPKKIEKPKEEMREIVRVSGTDLEGTKPLIRAIRKIKGMGYNMSNAVCLVSGIDPNKKLITLDESEIKKIEEIIKDPIKFGIPVYFVNRRKDRTSGQDIHLSGSDLDVAKKFDIQALVDMKNYKGMRHAFGLPVRGQRTRSSFRKGRSVGVIRKAVRIVQEEGKEGEKGKSKGKEKK